MVAPAPFQIGLEELNLFDGFFHLFQIIQLVPIYRSQLVFMLINNAKIVAAILANA